MADSVLDLLNEIVDLSAQLHTLTDVFPDQSSQTNPAIEIPPFELHTPSRSAIQELFAARGIPSSFAEELSSIHCDRASDLAGAYTKLYQQTCIDLCRTYSHTTPRTMRRLAKRLQDQYTATEESWKKEKLGSIQSLRRKSQNKSKLVPPSQPFNHDFIPYLEALYNNNSRPSRADKTFLAQKSGMVYRQIDIWFQNRRRRAKEQRLQGADPITDANNPVLRENPRVKSPQEEEATDVDTSGTSDAETDKSFNSRSSSFTLVGENTYNFTVTPPLSAFPARYPPSFEMYPFPCQHGDFSMPQFEWYRKPSDRSGDPQQSTNIDIDALVASFERLCLKGQDEDSNSTPDASIYVQGEDCDAMRPFTVRLLSAPLPSLVQRSKIQSIQITSGRDDTPRHHKRRALSVRSSQNAPPLKSKTTSSSPATAISHAKRQSIIPPITVEKTLHNGVQATGDLEHSPVVANCSQPEGNTINTEGRTGLGPRLYGDIFSTVTPIGEFAPISSEQLSANFSSPSTVESLQSVDKPAVEFPVTPPTSEPWLLGFMPDFDFLGAPDFTDLHSCSQIAGNLPTTPWGNISVDGYRNYLLSF